MTAPCYSNRTAEREMPLPAEQWEDTAGQIRGMPEETKRSNTV